MARTARHHRNARSFNRHLDVFNLRTRCAQITQICNRTLSLNQRTARIHGFFLVAFHRQTRAFQLTLRQITIRLGATGCTVRLCDQTVSITARLTGGLISSGQFRKKPRQRLMGLGGTHCGGIDLFKITLQFNQAVQLL